MECAAAPGEIELTLHLASNLQQRVLSGSQGASVHNTRHRVVQQPTLRRGIGYITARSLLQPELSGALS
jgi:hypothetical protein